MDSFEDLMSKPHLDGAKNQHYVPRFYLAGFAHKNQLAVFDRKAGTIKLRTPEHTARIRNLYTFEDKQDRRRFDIEKMFGYHEDKAAPIISRIAEHERISGDDREHLTAYLALAALRTPAAISEAKVVHAGFTKARSLLMFSTETDALRILREMEGPDANEETLREKARRLVKMIRDDAYSVEVDDGFALRESLKKFKVIADAMYPRDWRVFYTRSDSESFLTSDTPVVLTTTNSAMRHLPLGYGSTHAQILCPIAHNCAIVMSGDQGRTGRTDITSEALTRFNRLVAADSHRYVFGRDAKLVKQVTDELQLANRKWRAKSRVGIGQRVPGSGVWDVFVKRTGE
ncbi:DUF4238 domain-containing protein [Polaromonas sp. YR568]|uniref:DUF4238 domain-containing protein n=1 Tax=Polaromonas sp. YR568 TaxID=1855301 RepID=UPI003137DB18